jgi:hypothetical protein
MLIGAGEQPCRVACSHVYDPLDDMLVWLEAIVLDNTPARFVVDEEGSTVAFEAVRQAGIAPSQAPAAETAQYMLSVTPNYDAPTLQFTLSKMALVSAFYEALTAFGDSEAYMPAEWEYQSIADKIEQVTGQSFEAWVEKAVLLNRRALQMAIWQFELLYVEARYYIGDKSKLGTQDELEAMTDKESIPEGLFPLYWPLSEEIWDDGMAHHIEERRAYLLDGKNEKISAYSGYSWRKKRSMLVEQWLSLQKAPVEQGDSCAGSN